MCLSLTMLSGCWFQATLVARRSGRERNVVAELIRDVGFDPLDAGPWWIARYTEPFALLVAQIAYEGNGGPELADRFEWFRK